MFQKGWDIIMGGFSQQCKLCGSWFLAMDSYANHLKDKHPRDYAVMQIEDAYRRSDLQAVARLKNKYHSVLYGTHKT